MLVFGLGGGCYALWLAMGDHVVASDQYWMAPQTIEITPPPPWVRSDIKEEVIRDASLDKNLSILDQTLTEQIHQAFSLHPWVARVERVLKFYPAGVRVWLVYRKPVAMVEVLSGGLLPVDGLGVHLPIGDFDPTEITNYLRISGIVTTPLNNTPGTPWGDPRVEGGARIAVELQEVWQSLDLYQVAPSKKPARFTQQAFSETAQNSYELFTKSRTRILWGSVPGEEQPGEVSAQKKVQQLILYAQQHGGSLDHGPDESLLDLRQARLVGNQAELKSVQIESIGDSKPKG